jgi:hypothetical protein
MAMSPMDMEPMILQRQALKSLDPYRFLAPREGISFHGLASMRLVGLLLQEKRVRVAETMRPESCRNLIFESPRWLLQLRDCLVALLHLAVALLVSSLLAIIFSLCTLLHL